MNNTYPSIHVRTTFLLHNIGTIPVSVYEYNATGELWSSQTGLFVCDLIVLKVGDQEYEIYEDLTGKRPADDSPFLSMPASHPMLFVFDGDPAIAESFKTDLKAELDLMKIENPDLAIYGTPHDYVVILKTYTINERVAVEDVFSKAGRFTISQQMWVTPEVERQLVVMRETNDKGQ